MLVGNLYILLVVAYIKWLELTIEFMLDLLLDKAN